MAASPLERTILGVEEQQDPVVEKKVSKAASIVEKTPCGGAADPVVEKVSKAVSIVEKTP
jgi:hypothetical protein